MAMASKSFTSTRSLNMSETRHGKTSSPSCTSQCICNRFQSLAHLALSSLGASVEELGWPSVIDYASHEPTKREAFESGFYKLLALQLLGRKLHKRADFQPNEKDGLYAIEALALPVSLRFKYHYDSNRDTNRLDKPEWYLTYILNIAHDHRQFFDTVVQRLLSKSEFKSVSAWDDFVLTLLPILSRKIRKTVPQLLSRPSLFAHLIYQTLEFDSALVGEGFKIESTSAAETSDEPWRGISEVILGNPGWFNAWLQAEKKCQFPSTILTKLPLNQ